MRIAKPCEGAYKPVPLYVESQFPDIKIGLVMSYRGMRVPCPDCGRMVSAVWAPEGTSPSGIRYGKHQPRPQLPLSRQQEPRA